MPGRPPYIRPVRMTIIPMISIIPAPAPIVRRPGIYRPVRPPARRTMTDRRPIPRRPARYMAARRPTSRHMSRTTSPRWPSPRTSATRRLNPRTTRRPAPRPATRRMRRSRLHSRWPPRLLPTRTTRPSGPRLLARRRPAILRPDNRPSHNQHKKQKNRDANTHG